MKRIICIAIMIAAIFALCSCYDYGYSDEEAMMLESVMQSEVEW